MARNRSLFRSIRRTLHFTERTLGDVNAAHRGRLHKRLAQRHVTRPLWRAINRLFR